MKNILKKSLSVLLAITIIFSSAYVGLGEVDFSGIKSEDFFAIKSKAASTSDLTFDLNYDGSSYSVTDCNSSASGSLIIPSTYNGKPVTSIGNSAFYRCSSITSITLPDSVTSIGSSAFYYCTSLTSIVIPDGVTSIGNSAFSYCTGLTSITIPDGVTSIGGSAFYSCSSLTSITIPDSVTSIGNYAFYYCTGLTSITIPDSVTSIGSSAFYNCTGLTDVYYGGTESDWANIAIGSSNSYLTNATINCIADILTFTLNSDGASYSVTACDEEFSGEIVIPSTYNGKPVTSIGDEAFSYCTGLTSITIPDSVTSIGYNTFYYCTGLTSITIPDSVTSIGISAFSYCPSLTSITIPDSVTSIGNYAFQYCTGLTSITIPDSVTSIGVSVFDSCSSLTSITIPDSVTSIGNDAFYYTGYYNNSSNWENDVLYIGNHLIKAKTSLTGQYIIKTGTKTISAKAFFNCTGLTSITIPDSVTSIGNSTFYNCTGLTSITIPDSVTSIGDYAFSYCTGLTDVYYGGTESDWANIAIGSSNSYLTNATINCIDDILTFTLNSDGASYSVTDCDEEFSGEIVIPSTYNGKPVTSIGNSAFVYCSGLASITIPDSVTSIGRGAFSYCTGLTSITIPDSVTSIGSSAFYGCTGLTSITIPDSVTSIGDSAFYGCLSLTSITIPDSVTSIGDFAFYYCTGLTSITIPDSVTSIGDSAFDRCSSLTSITIPDSVTSIGNDAFYFTGYYDNSSNWENDVLYIGNHLIKAKTSLTGQYIIKTGTKTISANAFYNCTGLTSITIPDGVTSIGDDAFYRCLSLTSITIPDSVTSIGDFAFYYCTGLTSITIPDSVTSIGNSAFEYCKGLTDVYYGGTEADWANIAIGSYNSYLTNATINCIDDILTFTLNSDGASYSVTDCDEEFSGEIVIPSTYNGKPVTSIGNSAFYYCSSLTTITIPDGVTSIGSSAFKNCTSLTSITIPDSVTSIGFSAFENCTSLASVKIGDSVTSIGSYAFYNTGYYNNGNNWENDVLYIGNYLIKAKTTLSGEYAIKDGTKTISQYAFDSCKSLTSITIPDSVTSIGSDTFYNCKNLETVYITDVANWCSIDFGSSFSNPLRLAEFLYIDGELAEDIKIPEGVTSICDYAFSGCTSLTSVTIPDSVTSVGYMAFWSCDNLATITIPDSVTSIGSAAFIYCTWLTDVYYGGTKADWANIAIDSSNSDLTDATIHFHEHSYSGEWIIDTEFNCTEAGSKHNTCSTCGKLVTEVIPATGHLNTEWITELEPNCTEAGYKDEWCLDCFEIINTEEIPATGHLTTEWITEVEPNCTEAGYKEEWCLDCGEVVGSEEIPELGHSYGDWIIDTEPTCTEDGSKHQICSVCGDVNTEIILSEGHSFSTEWTIDVKATCTEEGSKSHHCIVCDNAKADVTVIAPLGHNFRAISVVNEHPHIILSECSRCPETKEEESYSEKCGVCNFTYTENADGTCKITAYTGSSDTLIIPATINGKTVATTNTGSFKNITTLTSVKIENGVQGIGSLAFLGCSSLSSVVIPESVTNIGSKAFYSCSSDLTIYCYRNSYAMQYAIDNGHNYVIIDIGETDNCTIDYDNKVIFTNDSFTTSLDEIVELPSTAEASVQASIVNGDKEIFGTGSVITITDGDITSEYTLIINGDLNGDATCDVIDASVAYLYSVGLQEATENEILAANGCASDELDAASYQNVVNMMLAS